MRTLRKLSQLSAREFWVLMQAAVLLPAVRCALRFFTIARLQVVGERTLTGSRHGDEARTPSPSHHTETEGHRIGLSLRPGLSPETIAHLVRTAAERGPYRAKCLEQSLVLRWLLQGQGIDARLVLGARKAEERLQAHAWVEVNGAAINEDHSVQKDFSPFEEVASQACIEQR